MVPTFFGTRDWLHGRQFFHGLGVGGWGMVSGWFKHVPFTKQPLICWEVVMRARESRCTHRWSFSRLSTLTSCSAALPDRLPPGTSLWPRGWGPLLWTLSKHDESFKIFKVPCLSCLRSQYFICEEASAVFAFASSQSNSVTWWLHFSVGTKLWILSPHFQDEVRSPKPGFPSGYWRSERLDRRTMALPLESFSYEVGLRLYFQELG